MSNKVVLVTGGSRGIGASTVLEFAKNGFDVVIDYVTSTELEKYGPDIVENFASSDEEATNLKNKVERDYGQKALIYKADVADEASVQNMIDEIIMQFGRIDVVVNNAAVVIDKELSERTVADWNNTFNINVVGMFLVSKYASKYMMESKYGKIVNSCSTNGINTVYPTSVDYDASKAAAISLTKNLAVEFAPFINVNATALYWADTEMNTQLPADFLDSEKARTLKERFADPSEVAKLTYFLASDDADYINGQVISIDGGNFFKYK